MNRLTAILLGLSLHIFAFGQVLMLDTSAHIGFYQEFDNVEGFEKNYGVESFNNNNSVLYSISIYDSDTSLYKMSVVKNDDDSFTIDFKLFSQSSMGISVLYSDTMEYNPKDFELYSVNVNGSDTHYYILKIKVDFNSLKAMISMHEDRLHFSDYYVIR